jgi:hypothetical protein
MKEGKKEGRKEGATLAAESEKSGTYKKYFFICHNIKC